MLKLIKYHPLFAYSVGDVFQVNEADTEYLKKEGYAEDATEEEAAQALEKLDSEEFNRLERNEAIDKQANAALNEAKGRSKSKAAK